LAAKQGNRRKSKQELKDSNGFNDEQVEIYHKTYDFKIGDKEQKITAKAKNVGYTAGRLGLIRKTSQQLKEEKGFNPAQIETYHLEYDKQSKKLNSSFNTARSSASGIQDAIQGRKRKTVEQLSNKGYSTIQVQSYYKSYDRHVPNEAKRKLFAAKYLGYQHGRLGRVRKSVHDLTNSRSFNLAQIREYYKVYDKHSQIRANRLLAKSKGAANQKDKAQLPELSVQELTSIKTLKNSNSEEHKDSHSKEVASNTSKKPESSRDMLLEFLDAPLSWDDDEALESDDYNSLYFNFHRKSEQSTLTHTSNLFLATNLKP
jgi:hypothetical protein